MKLIKFTVSLRGIIYFLYLHQVQNEQNGFNEAQTLYVVCRMIHQSGILWYHSEGAQVNSRVRIIEYITTNIGLSSPIHSLVVY